MATMISPYLYIRKFQNEPIENLLKIRDKLLIEIRYYENNSEQWSTNNCWCGTPEMSYHWNLQALSIVSILISAKHHLKINQDNIEKNLTLEVQKQGYGGVRKLINKFENRNVYETFCFSLDRQKTSKFFIENDYGTFDEMAENEIEDLKNSNEYFLQKPTETFIKSFEFFRRGAKHPSHFIKYKRTKKQSELSCTEIEDVCYNNIFPNTAVIINNTNAFERRVLQVIKNWRYEDYKIDKHGYGSEYWEFKIKFSNNTEYKTQGYNAFPEHYNTFIKYMFYKLQIKYK